MVVEIVAGSQAGVAVGRQHPEVVEWIAQTFLGKAQDNARGRHHPPEVYDCPPPILWIVEIWLPVGRRVTIEDVGGGAGVRPGSVDASLFFVARSPQRKAMGIEAGIDVPGHEVGPDALVVEVDRADGEDPLPPRVLALGDDLIATDHIAVLSRDRTTP